MTEDEFLQQIGDILQTDEALGPETVLNDQPAWDSLAWMMLLALAEREDMRKVKLSAIRKPGTIHDLYRMLTEKE